MALFAACDKGDPSVEAPAQGPAPHVVAASPLLDGSDTNVPVDAPVQLRFDRFMRPDTITRQSVRITGGTVDPDGGASVAGDAFLEPVYDMVERVATLRPNGNWAPSTLYTVTLWSPNDAERSDDGFGFRALDGQPLAKSISFHFTTGTQTGGAIPDPPALTACGQCYTDSTGVVSFVPSGAVYMQRTCLAGPCHGTGVGGLAQGLDLSSIEGIRQTAISRVAHQTLDGESSVSAPHHPENYGVNMPLIDRTSETAGNPANSYFMYKMLFTDVDAAASYESGLSWDDPVIKGHLPLITPPTVAGTAQPSTAENERLTRFVHGTHMPTGVGKLTRSDVKWIQGWIALGAPLDCAGHDYTQDECVTPTP